MNAHQTPPDLERLAAEEVAELLRDLRVGSDFEVDPSARLCSILELLVPKILRRADPAWDRESIDGFFFASAVKTGGAAADLAGTCILISDQTVTPIAMSIRLSEAQTLEALRVRLGEPGGGTLGISGPVSTSRAAQELLHGLVARLDDVQWVYDVSHEPSR